MIKMETIKVIYYLYIISIYQTGTYIIITVISTAKKMYVYCI